MADAIPIHVPRENVNDESVRLLHWRLKSGDAVRQGQPLAELETSKATFEMTAPADGVVSFTLREGQEVAVGGVLCHLLGEGAVAPAAAPQSAPTSEPATAPMVSAAPTIPANGNHQIRPSPAGRPMPRGTRISPLARKMIEQRGLKPNDFADKGLIRAADVLEALGEAPARTARCAAAKAGAPSAAAAPAVPPPVPAVGVPLRSEPLSRAKRVEGRYLSSGRHHTLASVITVACTTRGLRAAAAAYPGCGANATAIILFEAARLLRKYPLFNAFHADGNANFYEQINIGFALDGGKGLKAPVIRDVDQKNVNRISTEMQDLVVAYLEDKLPIESLAGGTFTVTDLSGEGVFSFHPLINQGQSAILGIGAEFFAPGSSVGLFNLILAFDHQLTEGRAAAKFLGDLRDRIAGYEQVMSKTTQPANEPFCSECLTPLSELRRNDHYLLQTIGEGGVLKPLCSMCTIGFK